MELQMVVSQFVLLGIKPGSSGRAANALDCCTISPTFFYLCLLPACLSACLCLSVYLSINRLSIYHLSICLSACLPLSVCLSSVMVVGLEPKHRAQWTKCSTPEIHAQCLSVCFFGERLSLTGLPGLELVNLLSQLLCLTPKCFLFYILL